MSKEFNNETAKVKTGHTSFETGLVSEYPWGFTQTARRTWIETRTIKKTGEIQMRVTHCMKHPKKGIWAKPKAGTYNAICILLQDDKGFISFDCLQSVSYSRKHNEEFLSKYKDLISPESLKQIERGNKFCDKMKELYA